MNRPRGAGLRASGQIVDRFGGGFACRRGGFLAQRASGRGRNCTSPPRRACGASRRIERLLHAGRPRRVPPVEVAGVIRAGRHAIAAAEAALRHLADHAGCRIDVDRLLRANMYAGSFVATMLAHHRHERRRGDRETLRRYPPCKRESTSALYDRWPLMGRAEHCSPRRRRPCTRRSRCSGRRRWSCQSAPRESVVFRISYAYHLGPGAVRAEIE